MKLVPGTIYFVREIDSKVPGFSDLVKIGLVEGDRSPFERLREHQTGNPRKLLFDESQFVRTDAVAFVESQLHSKFAKQRVSGEWFQFQSEQEIAEAVSAAREFADKAAAVKSLLKRAEELYWQVSVGGALAATEEAVEFGETHVRASQLISLLEAQMTEIKKAMFTVAAEAGQDSIQEFYKVIKYTREPKFSPVLLKDKFGVQMYNEYAFQEPQWAPKFEVLSPLVESTDYLNSVQGVTDLAQRVSVARTERDVYMLNELDLEIRTLLAPRLWQVLFAEAQLKVLCGVSPGIEGVCKWERKESLGNKKLDAGRLFEEKPEVYEACVAPGKVVSSRVRLPFKK